MFDRPYAGLSGIAMPITYAAISLYARDHDIPADEFPTFLQMVRVLDQEWLAFKRAQMPPEPILTLTR